MQTGVDNEIKKDKNSNSDTRDTVSGDMVLHLFNSQNTSYINVGVLWFNTIPNIRLIIFS